jgi:2',3'-cyclic-nucleotide 2'-phosphodiesterase (5'-nucleotidase family)
MSTSSPLLLSTTCNIRLCCINDVYTFRDVDGVGGFTNLATLLARHRDDASLFTVNGDFLGGSLLAEKFQGDVVVDVLKYLRPDAVTIGNHEFDYGPGVLQRHMRATAPLFPWLGANVTLHATGAILDGAAAAMLVTYRVNVRTRAVEKVASTTIVVGDADVVVVDGDVACGADDVLVRVGLFGVCTPATPHLSYPGDDVAFTAVDAAARRCVKALRRCKADVVVCVSHVRIGADKALAAAVDGIDLIVGGHDHDPYLLTEGETYIFKCGQNANFLGIVDMRLEFDVVADDGGGGRRRAANVRFLPSYSLVANAGEKADEGCAAIVERYAAQLREKDAAAASWLDTPLLQLPPLSARAPPFTTLTKVVRHREAAVGSLIGDALRWYFEARGHVNVSLGCINGGFVRGDRDYDAGAIIRIRDMREELPFPKIAVLLRLRGADLRAGVEQQLALTPAPTGAFPHYSRGMRLRYCAAPDAQGRRVTTLSIDGVDVGVDDDTMYVVAMTDFMAKGGDGCVAFARGERLATSGDEEADKRRHDNKTTVDADGSLKLEGGDRVFDIVVQYLQQLSAAAAADPAVDEARNDDDVDAPFTYTPIVEGRVLEVPRE